MASVTDRIISVTDNVFDDTEVNDEAECTQANDTDNNDEVTVIYSELLLYAQHYLQCASFDAICKTICEFYSNIEITEAKKSIWLSYGCHLPKIKWRRCVDANDKNVKDILDSLLKMDSLGIVPSIAAKRLDRLPKHEPDELKLISVVDKIRNLEVKLGLVEEGVNVCRKDIQLHDDRLDTIEKPPRSYAAATTQHTARGITPVNSAAAASPALAGRPQVRRPLSPASNQNFVRLLTPLANLGMGAHPRPAPNNLCNRLLQLPYLIRPTRTVKVKVSQFRNITLKDRLNNKLIIAETNLFLVNLIVLKLRLYLFLEEIFLYLGLIKRLILRI